jgi:hypothetical protein
MTLSLSKDGRKYTLVMLFAVVASAALFLRFCTFPEWTYFMIPWGAFYLAANVGQRIGTIKAGQSEMQMEAGTAKPKA